MDLEFHNELIVIDDWQPEPTYDGVYQKGARDKSIYYSPAEPGLSLIRPNWQYLFKLSVSRHPIQFWSEVVAYRFGCLIGVPVPPAYVALSRNYQEGEETYGALIEWFYDEKKDVYIEGGQIMIDLIEDYDRGKGEKHNWETIRTLGSTNHLWIHWAGLFTLDSLIGNTDRHQDNWGLVIGDSKVMPEGALGFHAPAFDNGTALGYEILDRKLEGYNNPRKMETYLAGTKAKHHMKWSLEDAGPINFYEFMKKLVVQSPEVGPIISQHLDFSREQLEEVLLPLLEIQVDEKHRLSPERLNFMIELIMRRKALLEEALTQCNT